MWTCAQLQDEEGNVFCCWCERQSELLLVKQFSSVTQIQTPTLTRCHQQHGLSDNVSVRVSPASVFNLSQIRLGKKLGPRQNFVEKKTYQHKLSRFLNSCGFWLLAFFIISFARPWAWHRVPDAALRRACDTVVCIELWMRTFAALEKLPCRCTCMFRW